MMEQIKHLKAERDTLQGNVDQLNRILKNGKDNFDENEVLRIKLYRTSMINKLKRLREEINDLS